MKPILLSYAGLDPSAGAGILADCSVFEFYKFRGIAIATAITAQNSHLITDSAPTARKMLKEQIRLIWDDFFLKGIKTGMLGSLDAVQVLADQLESHRILPFVLDPVLVSSSGRPLITPEAQEEMITRLFPLASLITPNLPEVYSLTGIKPQDEEGFTQAGEALLALGPQAVLIKGGHGEGPAIDRLYTPEGRHSFSSPRLPGASPHGTGCHLSSAILAYLAQGVALPDAVQKAKAQLTLWIASAQAIGQGKPYLRT